jgi:hypothetical protein
MLSSTQAVTWRTGEELLQRVKNGVLALSRFRIRWRRPRNRIRVSRLSSDWLLRHEIDAAKHDSEV